MFLPKDTGAQTLGRIIRKHRHGRLCNNRSGIHLQADEMYGAAVDHQSLVQRAGMRIEAWKRW